MTHGRGLDVNVGQLYEALAARFAPGDRVFMFGFSRGAFTVRALAGLVWGYGLPATAAPGRPRPGSRRRGRCSPGSTRTTTARAPERPGRSWSATASGRAPSTSWGCGTR